MFPDNQNTFGGLQQPLAAQMPVQQPMQQQWQVPPVNAQPPAPVAANPWSQFQGAAPQMMGQPGNPSMPSNAEQGDALQRLLAEIRARQGGAQAPAGNLQSMLGLR